MDGPATQRIGRVLAGRYQILDILGRGGHGVVYRAVQQPLGREVAVKVIAESALGTGSVHERFAREASLVQKLDHPNTVRLFDFGTSEEGAPFMVFELLRGRTLEQEIARGPLEISRACRVAAQVLKSLANAHAHGIVHRDVKPSNIFLVDYEGERDFVKVLDFGVARSLAAGPVVTASSSAPRPTWPPSRSPAATSDR